MKYGKRFGLAAIMCICLSWVCVSVSQAGTFNTTMPKALTPDYKVEILVPGCHFHGLKGVNFTDKNTLIVNDMVGGAINTVNIKTGEVGVLLEGPDGLGDDLVYGPDGQLCWTEGLGGKVDCLFPDGKIVTAGSGLPLINGIAFNKEGRLFASQVFVADGLWELDPNGKEKPRKVIDELGWLNAFEFGPDGKIYGPLMRMDKRCIARIDVETGKIETIAKGFKKGPFTVDSPNAVKFDPQGRLFGIQASTGLVYRVDIETGNLETIAELEAGLDNLAISSEGKIYVTNMINNNIYEIEPDSKKVRLVVEGKLATPQGLCVRTTDKGDVLYVADTWCLKQVDGNTGDIEILWESHFEFPKNVWLDGDTAVITGFLVALSEFDVTTGKNKKIVYGFGGSSKAIRLPDGSLIVAMLKGELLKVTGEKGENRTVVVKGLQLPSSLELAGPDAVYVTEAGPGTLSRINLSTGEKKVIASGLAKPINMTLGSDGKLLVVELGKKQLTEVDLKSGSTKPLIGNLPIGLPSHMPVWTYPGVAVSKSGNIYVAGDIDNAIYKITPVK